MTDRLHCAPDKSLGKHHAAIKPVPPCCGALQVRFEIRAPGFLIALRIPTLKGFSQKFGRSKSVIDALAGNGVCKSRSIAKKCPFLPAHSLIDEGFAAQSRNPGRIERFVRPKVGIVSVDERLNSLSQIRGMRSRQPPADSD